LKIEERRNKSLQDEIGLLKQESNNMMTQALQANKFSVLFDKDNKLNLFKKIMIHKECGENLQRIFDEYIEEFKEKEKTAKEQMFTNVEGFFKTMKDIGIGSIINFGNIETLNSLKEEVKNNHIEYLDTIDKLGNYNMQLLKASTEFKNTVLSRVSEYVGIRNELKEKVNNIIDSIPRQSVHELFSIAIDKFIENKKQEKSDDNMFQTLSEDPGEPQIKKIFIPNEDILDII